jgi:hypothetical protein
VNTFSPKVNGIAEMNNLSIISWLLRTSSNGKVRSKQNLNAASYKDLAYYGIDQQTLLNLRIIDNTNTATCTYPVDLVTLIDF